MSDQVIQSVIFSLLIVSSLVLLRVILGLRDNLYFISQDKSRISQQTIIPLTHLCKRSSFLNKNWKENVDITLNDHRNCGYDFNIRYGLFRHFFFQYIGEYDNVYINKKKIQKNKKYTLKKNDIVKVGNRVFKVHLTPKNLCRTEVFGVSSRI